MKSRAAMISAAFAIAGCAGAASAQTVLYSNNFESGNPGPEWSSNTQFIQHQNFTRYIGRYAYNQSVTLTLGAPPPPTGGGGSGGGGSPPPGGSGGGGQGTPGGGDSLWYNEFLLTFDLFTIDSWDGFLEPHGPDLFQIWVNGTKHFEESFANQHEMQSFRAPDVGPAHLGYSGLYTDSIYRQIQVPFQIGTATTISIKFRSEGLLHPEDESWGIDNVKVEYRAVPTPGSLGLLGAGAAMLLPRRRRRAV